MKDISVATQLAVRYYTMNRVVPHEVPCKMARSDLEM
jgi:hypothetical protein